MKFLGPLVTLESPGDPFNALQGINSTSSYPVLMGGTNTTPISSSNTNLNTNYISANVPTIASESNVVIPISSTETPTSSNVLNDTVITVPQTNIVQGNPNSNTIMNGGIPSGGSSVLDEKKPMQSISNMSFLDKLKALPDWKKGLIVLAIVTASYYGYKKIK